MTDQDRTYNLIRNMNLDELKILVSNCRPDKAIMLRNLYGFIPDRSVVESMIADYILLEMSHD